MTSHGSGIPFWGGREFSVTRQKGQLHGMPGVLNALNCSLFLFEIYLFRVMWKSCHEELNCLLAVITKAQERAPDVTRNVTEEQKLRLEQFMQNLNRTVPFPEKTVNDCLDLPQNLSEM